LASSSALLVALAMGCAHPQVEQREVRHEVRGAVHEDWTKLGQRWVDGTKDRDVIVVGEQRGLFRRIMIVVEHSALEMFDVEVTFGDGSTFSPQTRHVFSADSRSHTIDLPGHQRVISKVSFRYANLPGRGRAQVELWAL
jgi:hypothetical protein